MDSRTALTGPLVHSPRGRRCNILSGEVYGSKRKTLTYANVIGITRIDTLAVKRSYTVPDYCKR